MNQINSIQGIICGAFYCLSFFQASVDEKSVTSAIMLTWWDFISRSDERDRYGELTSEI